MPAKKKLTKKKPAAKAAQPSSKKRPMSTKAKPAAKKAAPKAKANPMAKKKKPAAKKPARRPLHEGGTIDADLLAEQTRRNEQQKPARPNPNVPRPNVTPEQQQAMRTMNQARFSGPQFRQGSFPKPIRPIQPSVPADPNYVPVDPGYDRPRPTQNNQPTRVPFNQPPMDRRPQPTRPTVSPPQQQAMRAMNQARFTRPQITPEMQAAARQRQQGTTPRPMNKGGMVLTPEQYQRAAALTRPKNKRR